MRPQISLVPIALLLAAQSLRADDETYPAGKIRGRISINPATGERVIDQSETSSRTQSVIWDCTNGNPIWGAAMAFERLDWGDIAPTAAASVSYFEFAYCSTSYTPDPTNGNVDLAVNFYVSENGNNSPAPPSSANNIFVFRALPGITDPNSEWTAGGCWLVDVDLRAACMTDPNVPCSLGLGSATDVDGDGLLDFGYGLFVLSTGPNPNGDSGVAGPIYAYPGPDPAGAPGATSDYNRFAPPGKWQVGNAGFLGSYDNGEQIWLQLRGCTAGDADADGICDDADQCPTIAGPPPTGCPTCPDLTGDQHVDLSDLAIVLSNFGLSPATYAQGDIDHDNHVDLSDLAALLSAYGATCP